MIGEGGKERSLATMSNGEIGVSGSQDVEEVADNVREGNVAPDSRVEDVDEVF